MHFLKKEAQKSPACWLYTALLIRLQNNMPVFLSGINRRQVVARNRWLLPEWRVEICFLVNCVSSKRTVSPQAIQKFMQTSGRLVNLEVVNYDGQCFFGRGLIWAGCLMWWVHAQLRLERSKVLCVCRTRASPCGGAVPQCRAAGADPWPSVRSESGSAAKEEAAGRVCQYSAADGRLAGGQGERGSAGASGVIVSDGHHNSCVFILFQTGPQEWPHRSAYGCRRGQRRAAAHLSGPVQLLLRHKHKGEWTSDLFSSSDRWPLAVLLIWPLALLLIWPLAVLLIWILTSRCSPDLTSDLWLFSWSDLWLFSSSDFWPLALLLI